MLITSSMAANKKKQSYGISVLLFLCYLLVLCYLLFFAENFGRTEISDSYRYNLTPFLEIRRFLDNVDSLGWNVVIVNLLGNIVAFMPFGFFLPRLLRLCKNVWFTVVCGMVFSALVELCQFLTKVGSFDVDDVILNTFGTFLGFLIFLLYRRWRKQ